MPYTLPSPPSSPVKPHNNPHRDNHKLPPQRNHRRSTSPQLSQGVFAPLTGLPRRKSSLIHPVPGRADTPSPVRRARAQFSIKASDEDEESTSLSEDSVEDQQEVTKLVRGLALNIDPSFPSSASPPVPFPQLPDSRPHSPNTSTLPKVFSNPIILPNGKPLKPSLKSASAPHLPDELKSVHLRARSAPSTPITQPKNVHFKDEKDGSLETVRIFNKAGRPANINYSSGNEETETEAENDTANTNSFPFPSTTAPEEFTYRLADPPHTSAIPALNRPATTNVHLESVTLHPSRPPLLRGSILVRNVTFAKLVAVRFTFDEWQTTSEVTGHYVTSLPSLPSTIDNADKDSDSSSSAWDWDWDWATSATRSAVWDRFSFTIRLEDMERKLLERTMFLAVRYRAEGENGGEWWDNNDGQNYKINFRLHPSRPFERPRPIPAYKPKINDMFNMASTSPSFPPSGLSGLAIQRPGIPSRSQSNPTVPTFLTLAQMNRNAPKSRLRLSNYIAPSSANDEEDENDGAPSSTFGRSSISPIEFQSIPPTAMIGGMPATAPAVPMIKSIKPSLPTPTSSPVPSPNSSSVFIDRRLNSSPDKIDDQYSQFVKKFCFHQSTPAAGTTSPPTTSMPPKEPWRNAHGGQQAMLMSL